MLVFDPAATSCQIYEIKHSSVAVPEQARHLKDQQKCAETERRFGPIVGKYVIYRGESVNMEEIKYINVEEYLLAL